MDSQKAYKVSIVDASLINFSCLILLRIEDCLDCSEHIIPSRLPRALFNEVLDELLYFVIGEVLAQQIDSHISHMFTHQLLVHFVLNSERNLF